ncbi:MAG: 23S rRNA pseudouridine(1911/1915/1917) synthase RluD [Xanthomonadales bacterium]|nr:Ribosomal large subunit pseudouridine synthase D [Xanthomonadales bacterium]MCC6594042.1 23S rRNA pseudouridine(1911/1915/1917) synthase RluD [Xanthomonadales bacterium]MCE7932648.1 23S rRNA pseudouridine(1911/1915/1917) synthase RluD [Xanthomonadales bacterium PRO6]
MAATETHQAHIPMSAAGLRMDAALAQTFPQFSRARLTQWLKDGRIVVEDRSPRPRDSARGGERVRLCAELETVGSDAPEDIALDLLVEDPAFFVIAKPAGLVVHPGAGNRSGTLVNALLHRDPALVALPRAGIVHRLDKDTSGALVVARTPAAHHALVKALAKRQITREYLALVQGRVIAGGSIDAPIGRHPGDRLRMAVVEGGKPARSHYRVVERFDAHTLLRVALETGRTHQIRVHLAHLHWPIIGDPLYGGGLRLPAGSSPALVEVLRGFRRQALHAQTLVFAHPVDGREVRATAPLPVDFQTLLEALRAP